jgi:hypothetical protein
MTEIRIQTLSDGRSRVHVRIGNRKPKSMVIPGPVTPEWAERVFGVKISHI